MNTNIPDSWIWVKSKQVGDIINGDRGKNYPSRQHYITNGIPFISAGNLSDGKVLVDSLNYISEEKYNSLNNGKLLKGDIIYCIRGTLGKCIIFDLVKKAAIASSLVILRLSNLLNKHYVFYFLQSPYGRELIKKFDNGTAQPNLSAESFSNYEIPVAPLPEQYRIVAKIEELFSSLDKGIESLKTAQQQLKVYRQAVLKWAFEGKLTKSTLRQAQGTVMPVAEVVPEVELMPVVEPVETTFPEEGELPEDWARISLKELVDKIADGPFGSNLKTADYVDDGVRVIRLENIGYMEFRNEFQSFVTKTKYETIKKHTVSKGDIIFSSFISENIRAAILPDFIDKAINKADCFLVRPSENKVSNKYLFYYFSTREMYQQLIGEIHGATRPRINTTQLKSCQIPIPPLPEQHAIVAEIESRLSVCDKIEESIEQSLKQAESLRQSILKKAFAGKLVPQDPDDEPASKLLERIKMEKEKTVSKKRSRKRDLQ